MDLILVPSRFTKQTLEQTSWDETHKQTGQLIKQHKITKPIEVLPEGVELELYQTPPKIENFLERRIRSTLYIANRAFGGLRKFSAIYQHRQIFNLAFKMNKLKTKYKNVAQSKLESLSLSTALLAIY